VVPLGGAAFGGRSILAAYGPKTLEYDDIEVFIQILIILQVE
jgi:hypothetical protein